MSTGMVEIMKMAAMDAIENSKPCDLRFGTVISVNPLKVQITSELIIPESLIVVPEYLTDYSVNVNMGMSNQSILPNYLKGLNASVSEERLVFSIVEASSVIVSNEKLIFSTNESANDVVVESAEDVEKIDERTLTVYNTLKIGDKVVLIRNQGGKVYYILDRV